MDTTKGYMLTALHGGNVYSHVRIPLPGSVGLMAGSLNFFDVDLVPSRCRSSFVQF